MTDISETRGLNEDSNTIDRSERVGDDDDADDADDDDDDADDDDDGDERQ